ncbi:hypothetical protein AVEN_251227-1 [Araneus ventricosus]|uniref:Uncharacterized protein n=1 Tax=Araneus ventricosus TaxID=182803 RepID=A0A4Y2UX17_ARAVE|nr:hypothetical protein AVEN_251227-1 [Araneus ventricosus]
MLTYFIPIDDIDSYSCNLQVPCKFPEEIGTVITKSGDNVTLKRPSVRDGLNSIDSPDDSKTYLLDNSLSHMRTCHHNCHHCPSISGSYIFALELASLVICFCKQGESDLPEGVVWKNSLQAGASTFNTIYDGTSGTEKSHYKHHLMTATAK